MKSFNLITLLSICYVCAYSQGPHGLRTFQVTNDTVVECYRNGQTDCFTIDTGISITISYPSNFLLYSGSIENGQLHGQRVVFYFNTSIPQEAGIYFHGLKDGTWNYWNKSGKLVKRERWSRGKILISKRF